MTANVLVRSCVEVGDAASARLIFCGRQTMFNKIITNPNQTRYQLLPPQSMASQHYRLRHRTHDRELPSASHAATFRCESVYSYVVIDLATTRHRRCSKAPQHPGIHSSGRDASKMYFWTAEVKDRLPVPTFFYLPATSTAIRDSVLPTPPTAPSCALYM